MELGVAIAAVIISLVSFVVNLYASRTADRHARMPVLIAQWYKAADGGHRVSVRNIGKGPAVNVVIANALSLGLEGVRWRTRADLHRRSRFSLHAPVRTVRHQGRQRRDHPAPAAQRAQVPAGAVRPR